MVTLDEKIRQELEFGDDVAIFGTVCRGLLEGILLNGNLRGDRVTRSAVLSSTRDDLRSEVGR